MQFSRFITSDPVDNKLMLRFSDPDDKGGIWEKGGIQDGGVTFLGLVLDTDTGRLAAKSGSSIETVIESKALKYENITAL